MLKASILIGLVLIFAANTAQADRRKYVWTYQYMTMPQGQTELELYQTTKLNAVDSWEFRGEIEHGITPRWDISIYQIFAQKEGSSLKWDAVQARTRYRLGVEGQYFMDPLLYFEYNRKTESTAPNKLEAKLILAKTMNKANLSLNPLYEYFFAPGSTHEIGMDAGISYEFVPAFSAGMESVTRIEFEEGESITSGYFGPTISFASGNWWYSMGFLVGLNDNSDDGRVRFLMGVHL